MNEIRISRAPSGSSGRNGRSCVNSVSRCVRIRGGSSGFQRTSFCSHRGIQGDGRAAAAPVHANASPPNAAPDSFRASRLLILPLMLGLRKEAKNVAFTHPRKAPFQTTAGRRDET